MINDVARAFFNTPPAFVTIRDEGFEDECECRRGELLVSMYDARLAANHWQKGYIFFLTTDSW